MKQQLQQIYRDLSEGKLAKAAALDSIKALKLQEQGSTTGVVLASPVWQASVDETSSDPGKRQYTERHIVLCELSAVNAAELEALVPRSRCLSLQAAGPRNIAERYSDYAVACFERVQAILSSKPQGSLLIQVVVADDPEQRVLAGLSGLLKTAALENPQLFGQCVLAAPHTTTVELARHLQTATSGATEALIRYEQGVREIRRWQVMPVRERNIQFRDRGVYLITGGLGGLGVLFAQEILEQTTQARVILTGRSELDAARQAVLAQLSAQPGRVDYRSLDVSNAGQVRQLIAAIQQEHGQLNGIIHAAGMIADNFILKKTPAEFRQVLAPKVIGTFNLDQASRDIDLDFLVLCSSLAAVMGNPGQADYAAANGFMDQFSAYRNGPVGTSQRGGRTLSINWPFWLEGGMSLDQASRESLQRATGIEPMQTATGMQALYQCLQSQHGQMLVMEGELAQLHRVLANQTMQPERLEERAAVAAIGETSPDTLLEKTEDYLRKQFSALLKLPSHKIDPRAALEKYGIDSILAVNLINRLEKTLGPLSRTLLFEYQTIHGLAEYFVGSHPAALATLFAESLPVTQPKSAAALSRRPRFSRRRSTVDPAADPAADADPIAIVGLSGRYPEAVDIETYWHNLREGKDCIIEVPTERWDWREYFSEDRTASGRHYSKWGGFMAGVDEFDPLFFNISPKEAKSIDPQERLFLQHAWLAIEDAGYTRASLQAPHGRNLAGQVGVYVGAMHSEYQLFGAEASLQGQRMAVSSSFASIANRVSYVLNLHGPSMTLDTMCSSSLTAIHIACQDLQQGRTSLAIAGGVNVSIHPNKYLLLSAGQFISGDGHCQSFGEGGDGYIPGEGVGVVILKRLSAAVRDGNIIYGVIAGTALNHGGKTNGYTVPNPQAQADVIRQALADANVDPRHISYVEAHGTGTKLGDPIEIAALSHAFRGDTQASAGKAGSCSIGSVKSNIGHCESAAGIAGLTKVLLQLKHQLIAPSLHCRKLNPHIDFANTPFVVNQALQAWQQPEVDGRCMPRIAGISSFGAGGSNAHIIVAEYQAPAVARAHSQSSLAPIIVPLSARTAGQLQQRARDLLAFIGRQEQAVDLRCLAHTLQVGREPMDHRLGFLVSSLEQLSDRLEHFLAGDATVDDVYRGQVQRQQGPLSVLGTDADFQRNIDHWIAQRKLSKLLELWVSGFELDWQKFYGNSDRPRLMSLPGYPFAKERYWIERPASAQPPGVVSAYPVSKPTKIALAAQDESRLAASAPKGAVTLRDLASPDSLVESPRSWSADVQLLSLGDGVFSIAMTDACALPEHSTSIIESFQGALHRARQEESVKVLLIKGEERGFWQGDGRAWNQAVRQLLSSVASFPYPVIAVMRGDAGGSGFLLGCVCDLIVCSDNGRYSYTDSRHGLFPSATDERFFRERLGEVLADDFLYRSAHLTGRQLRQKGWGCSIVPAAQVDAQARELAAALAQKSHTALRLLKAHLGRQLLPLIDALAVDVAVLQTQDSFDQARAGQIISPAEYLQLEVQAGSIVVVRIAATRQSYSLKELGAHLRNVFDQIEGCSSYGSIVLTSDHAGFLPQTETAVDSEVVLDLQRLLQGCKLPVIAALTANAEGLAWLLALWCDACVYQTQGRYCASGQWTTPSLAQEVAALFVRRLGLTLGQEVCLTADSYSGLDLQARVGALTVVEPAEVMPQALRLAAFWCQWPRETVAAWKKVRESHARDVRKALPVWQEWEEEVAETLNVSGATAAAIALRSTAVTVTAHPDGVVVIGMQERQANNAFSETLLSGLKEAFAHIERTHAYKVVVLTGYDNYFATGGTKETLLAIQEGRTQFTDERVFQWPMECPLPVIAAMQGHAIGAGWSFGMFADLILFSDESRYLSPYMGYGFTPGAGSTLVFPEKIGHDLARETLLTAKEVSGRELRERGLQLPVLPRRDVLPTAIELARRIARHPRERLKNLKRQWTHALRQAREPTYQCEVQMHEQTFVGKADTLEHIHARFDRGMLPTDSGQIAASEAVELAAVIDKLRSLLARELHMQVDDIDEGVQFTDLGLDSVTGVIWIRKINECYGTSVEATKVYSNPTLAELGRFVKLEVEKLRPPQRAVAPHSRTASSAPSNAGSELVSWRRSENVRLPAEAKTPAELPLPPIAVIGMAGQFPQANNLDQFWANIAAGRNCISEVPEQRWYLDAYYREGAPVPGKTNSKWLGALEEYDLFDPLFFNISPTEAECMDPQQRVFLQACWHSIENAGYNSRSLSGSRCGVFVGCAAGDYHQLQRKQPLSAQDFTGAATSILAARIAYFLNLRGPCIAIDTACSSSLVAIADACDSLSSGDSDLALAGGVYVMSGPSMHIMTSQAGMLSPDGRCFTFDQRANGFVIGEAVGVVVLKRLADAQRDHDRILGVIEGWGVNQDGRSNGITAPNEESQARLLQGVYEKFKIAPEGIQLIEAHGTGTKLGDPIEVAGLKAAFKSFTDRQGGCALGSVKSNIGHCLTAAGVAGIIKLMLALKHKQLPPTVNFAQCNEHIQLAGTAFYVNDSLKDWSVGGNQIRRAAISSFGFSGTNAHLVIAEHAPALQVGPELLVLTQEDKLIVPLSARTEVQLRQKASDLLEFIRKHNGTFDLIELAYTLQVGRDPMGERMGFLVGSMAALTDKLERYLAGEHGVVDVYQGQVKQSREEMKLLSHEDDIRETVVKQWLDQRKLSRLLGLWVKGLALDWNLLYGAAKPRRIELPGYPFAKERFWIGTAAGLDEPAPGETIHPLLHRNASLLSQQRYQSTFSGEEFFLDQKVDGARVFPAMSLLEMARAAVVDATSDLGAPATIELSQMEWQQPLLVTETTDVAVTLLANDDNSIAFEVRTAQTDTEGNVGDVTHARGLARFTAKTSAMQLDIAAAQARMTHEEFEPAEFYAASSRAGLYFGKPLQGLRAIYRGSGRLLARISVPGALSGQREYGLHPALLESALQACRVFVGDAASSLLPAAMSSLTIASNCEGEMFASVRYSQSDQRTLDVDLTDVAGNACVSIRGLELSSRSKPQAQPWDGISYIYRWEERIDSVRNLPGAHKSVLIVGSDSSLHFAATIREHYRQGNHAEVVLIRLADETAKVAANEWRCGIRDAAGFESALQEIQQIDALYFLATSGQRSEPSAVDEREEVQLLRLVKCLKQNRKIDGALDAYILTTDNYSLQGGSSRCSGAGAAGLGYSLAQGNYQFRVRNLDLSSEDLQSSQSAQQLFSILSREPPSDRGEVFKIQAGKRYRQTFLKLNWGAPGPPTLRQNGVYLIVGGSGIVGRIFTRNLIQKYQATVVWLGRSAEDSPNVQAALQGFAEFGDKLLYVQADVLSLDSMRQAISAVKDRYAAIHGAIFSGMVFGIDNSIDQITQAEFGAVVAVKTLGSCVFHAALSGEPLDFMCYFSSGQAYSFSGASRVAAYAAGISFTDSFVRSIQQTTAFPVGTINWGAWKAFVKERMGDKQDALAKNMGALDDQEGFECFERFVGALEQGRIHQVLCMRASAEVQSLMNCNQEELVTLVSEASASATPGAVPSLENAIEVPHERIAHLQNVQASSQLDAWFSQLLLHQLNRLVESTGPAIPATVLELHKRCGILDKYGPWLNESLRLLAASHCIELQEGVIRSWNTQAAKARWQEWQSQRQVYAEDPQTKALTILVNDCLEQLPDILQGKLSATEVIFPNSSMEKVASLYQNNAIADTFNEIIANAVLAYLQQRQQADPRARLRILEIGAGTGGTSAAVFSKLSPCKQAVAEYCYTDLSKAFFLHAQEHYVPENPYVVCRRLDIEQPIEAQGIAVGTYDLVIASNVLHATRDIRQTLRNAKAALHRNGFLLLNEMSDKSLATHLTVALLDGWWLFEDPELRIPGSPGLYPQGWRRVLEEEGFSSVQFPAEQGHVLGNQIIVARSDGIARQQVKASPQPKIAARPPTSAPVLERSPSMSADMPPDMSSDRYVHNSIRDCLSSTLKIPAASIEADSAFADYGIDSILGVNFVKRLNERLRISLNTAIIFEYSSVDRLSDHIMAVFGEQIAQLPARSKTSSAPQAGTRRLVSRSGSMAAQQPQPSASSPQIAVIGMAGRFPKAETVREFWSNLVHGVDGVAELPAHYLQQKNFSTVKQQGKTRCKWGGILTERDCFDPLFFNLAPREAQSMNPHQRLVMQESWNAIEDAGHDPKTLAGTQTGIFVGAEPSGYRGETFTGLSEAIVASRLSYVLNLNGPAFVVNTGCSSSAVAIHLACESLRNRETDLALAGGVHACMSQSTQIRLDEIEMLSPSGRCFTFDQAGDGTIVSEGIGMVVLKRLDDAIAAGDHIYGIIAASGVNQDGASNGITAPNGAAQELLIRSVYDKFQIDPEEISYVEAHGTGTKLGDPVETNALVRAFKNYTAKQGYCAVGSAKSHIGHTAAAAGVTGLIKVLLSMQHQQLPKLLNFKTINPLIEFQQSPFFIATESLEWQSAGQPRMAALNSFGHSGTNVHMVIKEYVSPPATPQQQAGNEANRRFIIPLSARTKEQLRQKCRDLLDFIAASSEPIDLTSMAYTLQVGRQAMAERLGFIVSSPAQLAEKLQAYVDGENHIGGDLADGDLEKRLEQWANGASFDWNLLWDGAARPQRMSLPGYPFAKERYWTAHAADGDSGSGNFSNLAANRESIADLLDRIDDESIAASDGVKLLQMIV